MTFAIDITHHTCARLDSVEHGDLISKNPLFSDRRSSLWLLGNE